MGGLLDEVYERLRRTGPEFDGWLSNHGPMAADALLRLGPDSEVHVHRWVDRYLERLEDAPTARCPISAGSWPEVLGDASRLGDWLAFFDRELAERPWPDVLATWWPRLLPGAVAAATHGLIRTGHAVRALREEETAPRVSELAQALGYWAARWQPVPGDMPPRGARAPGPALDALPVLGGIGDVRRRLADLGARPDWAPALAGLAPVPAAEVPAALDALVDAAVVRYGRWAHGSPVMLVHAATAPRAAALVLPSLPLDLWPPTFRAAWVTSAAITAAYRPAGALPEPPSGLDPAEATEAAVRSGDEHAVKFAEVAGESAARGVPTAVGTAQRAAELIGRTGG
ncbi:Protein of unknown function [Modestobacter sp. DSM 44400]|uniref:questin oxidase family protein n=1 Tax=Modestobacter sp. DSM 44400 TaxID=1550230 RepID=UPI00089AE958|nr:questin oxidase family protein [Modestobacter sp. DSM 44400]SDX83422.1 Protein of unknown function [Modestobacter sp. DSM 44400]